MKKIVCLSLLLILLPAVYATAEEAERPTPSFDCARASTKVEKMICADSELSRLDAELAKVYAEALAKHPDYKSNYVPLQKTWLKERNKCVSIDCVSDKYKQRIAQLKPAESAKTGNSEDNECLEPKINWRDYAWVLITGKERPACQDMLAYLQSRPSDAPPPVCPEDRLPPNKDWTRPEGRDLTEAERQALIDDLPEHLQEKTKGRGSIEWQFKNAKLLRAINADITRDGIPEYLLAYATHDYRQACETATQCAVAGKGPAQGGISIGYGDSYHYAMQPLNAEGNQINWNRRPAGYPPMLMGGELIYYKGKPYWFGYPEWAQKIDGRPKSAYPITAPHGAMIKLSEVYVGTGKQGDVTPNFEDVIGVAIEHDPESQDVCRFGYFNRERIEHALQKGGK